MFKSILNTISSWGFKESKLVTLTYDEARSRMTDVEYNRLVDAFKRVAISNSHINKQTFTCEVLGDLFPISIAEYIYGACGGTSKGILFKDLVAALVLLTRGTIEEKIKFVFLMYAGDGTTIIKDTFIKFTKGIEGVQVPESVLNKLFNQNTTVEFDEFQQWLLTNRQATSLSCWLIPDDTSTFAGFGVNLFKLTEDHDTPTFYQTLAGVTHLEEEDIIELEKRYWQLHSNSRNGTMDFETLQPLISPPLPLSIVKDFLDAFDENRDNHIDFKEMACGISAAARGPALERQKFCFKIFDHDKDGLLSMAELRNMVAVMKLVMEENLAEVPSEEVISILTKDDEILVQEILMSSSTGQALTLGEYLVWSLSNRLPEQFLTLIYQVCQIVLGLHPLDPLEEYEVVTSWLTREEKRGFQPKQTWYIISVDWWNSWLNYVSPNPPIMSNSDSGLGSTIGSIGSHSNSIASFSDSNVGGGSSTSTKSNSSSRCWSIKRSTVESPVAMDVIQNVVVTGISPYDVEIYPGSTPTLLSPHTKSSSSSLSLVTLDSSSNSPSPVNSPGSFRRQLNGSLNGHGRLTPGKRRKPDAIDNSNLVVSFVKVPSLTNEGARIKTGVEPREYKIVPQTLWNALNQWYGSGIALPRQVIETEKNLELELHLITILLYRHQLPVVKRNIVNGEGSTSSSSSTPWTGGIAGMYGVTALNSTISYVQNQSFITPKRILSFTASFSRQATLGLVFTFICQKLRLPMKDTRLDLLTNDDLSFAMVLEEENQTMDQLGVTDLSNILIEVRNKNQTWPEEIGSISSNTNDHLRLSRTLSAVPVERGLTGLNNLGNTCYLNSAIQCVSNIRPLTLYFTKRMHMYELNRSNPLGMKGHIAKRYGDLVADIWSGTAKTIAPIKLKYTLGKYEPRFSTFVQNDAQEFLAFLLDGLHEDLNRVTEKPYIELKDSDNRPDVICAQEAWENHLLRNKSIVVDLFHGQLKSSVRCKECQQESCRFDPFTYLTLPLPMESYIFCDFIVVRQNGTVPVRYGLLASIDESISDIKTRLTDLMTSEGSFKMGVESILLVQIQCHRISRIFKDSDKITGIFNNFQRVHAFQTSCIEEESQYSNGRSSADLQIQRLLTSSKNQHTANQCQNVRPPAQPAITTLVENGHDNSSGQGHSRQSSVSSYGSYSTGPSSTVNFGLSPLENVILVMHRKMLREENYFVAPQKSRPVLFGLPLVIPFIEGMTHLDLYKRVWSLVSRLVSPLPPSEGPNIYNHALDCDDSLGYEYPFVLRIVTKDSEWCCGRCSWFAFCRGCPLACSENERLERMNSFTTAVAIDWDPTALHLRYQTTQEFEYIEHPSVQEAQKRQSESVALTSCLDTFTKSEELSEEEKYYCARCGGYQLAMKRLQIWRLPPILIVNLKRFAHLQGRWIKSHKVVRFPFHDLDPTKYLADVPRRTSEVARVSGVSDRSDHSTEFLFPLQDFHQHRLLPETDAFSLSYRLFAIVCHTGIMHGGHYISYSRNSEGKWHCFNDSSCKEVPEDQIETNTAYMLLYERAGLDCDAYLPRIDPKAVLVMTDDEMEAEEQDLKKMCTVM